MYSCCYHSTYAIDYTRTQTQVESYNDGTIWYSCVLMYFPSPWQQRGLPVKWRAQLMSTLSLPSLDSLPLIGRRMPEGELPWQQNGFKQVSLTFITTGWSLVWPTTLTRLTCAGQPWKLCASNPERLGRHHLIKQFRYYIIITSPDPWGNEPGLGAPAGFLTSGRGDDGQQTSAAAAGRPSGHPSWWVGF